MSNVLSNEQRQQILALGRLGWTLRRIEQATRSSRETVSAYLKAAGLAVRGPGRPATQAAKPAISGEVSTDSAAAHPATTGAVSTDAVSPGRAPTTSACEPFRERIEAALTQGRNAVAIYQDLVSDHGFPASYASVRRFVRRLRGRRSVEASVVITTAPGEEGQVDYGSGPMVRDPHSGRYRRTRLFAFTLGYSRKSVRLLVWRSTTQIWAELHERAFRRLGGTVRVVVHDNLREGVLTPDIYDPTLNPLYRDVLAHDGVIALPCRVRDPDRKGTVEASIGHAQKTPLKGLRFETRIGAQAYLDRWETRWADTRIHGTTKRQVAAMFAEERPALGPLPLEPFRYYRHGVRTVHLDGCVEVEAAYYSAPPGWIGQRACRCSGTGPGCGSWPPPPGCSSGSISARPAAGIASTTRTGRRGRPAPPSRCSPAPRGPGPALAPSASTSTSMTGPSASGASSACSPASKSTGRPPSRTPPRRRWTSACPPPAFCGAISTADRPLHLRCARSIP